eukprot:g8207.t1
MTSASWLITTADHSLPLPKTALKNNLIPTSAGASSGTPGPGINHGNKKQMVDAWLGPTHFQCPLGYLRVTEREELEPGAQANINQFWCEATETPKSPAPAEGATKNLPHLDGKAILRWPAQVHRGKEYFTNACETKLDLMLCSGAGSAPAAAAKSGTLAHDGGPQVCYSLPGKRGDEGLEEDLVAKLKEVFPSSWDKIRKNMLF